MNPQPVVDACPQVPGRCRRAAGQGLALALAALLCGATGCAHVPGTEAAPDDGDVPAAWSTDDAAAAGRDTSLARWWLHFGDGTLADLVAQALRANPTVLGAQAALREARASRDETAATLWPTLTGSASAQRTGIGRRQARGGQTTNVFKAGLDAQWEIDVFGADRSAVDASEATVRASAASLGDAQVSLAAEVALQYIALRGAQARLAIASDNLAAQQETLQITAWRNQAGLVTFLELEQARAAAEQTAALVPALRTRIDQASHALAVLAGRPPAGLAARLGDAVAVPLPGDPLALRLPADTLRQRADVRAAEQRVRAAQAGVRQAQAARWPALSIGGSLGLGALTLGLLSHGSSVASSLLGSVSLPVLDGGARAARVDVQQAALEQARSAWRATVLSALQEVEDALAALRDDRLRLAHLTNAADAAADAAQLARQRYASGLVDFRTVLDTQRTRLGTQDDLANARADVSSDHVRLYKALGGGWEPELSGAATP